MILIVILGILFLFLLYWLGTKERKNYYLQSFDNLKKVKIEWVNGIENIYEGNDALKRFNLSKDLKNIALFFREADAPPDFWDFNSNFTNDEFEYILIHIPTSNIANVVINNIIKLNGGLGNFKEVTGQGEWKSLYNGDQFTVGYLPGQQAVRLNKHYHQEPEIINSDNNQGDKYFFGNVNEIINIIKSNPNVKIIIEANEYWDGVYQLKEDKESDSIEHFSITDYNEELAVSVKNGEVTVGENYEGYNLKKKAYINTYYTWAKALIDNEDLLDNLNDFLEDENYDENSDLQEFFQFMEVSQTPDDAVSCFACTNFEGGIGREIGVDDICWTAEVYVRQADVELYSLDL